jgi:basic membrane lipoprotein Med (substrate-binding protein (PBP1-ABC) superfamily)/DNA-binding SARP family transcriptional activator
VERRPEERDGDPKAILLPVASYDGPVRFEVLGPLRAVAPVPAGGATADTGGQALGGPKQRLVLALLLAEPNTTISLERLIDGVWGERPPDSARHTLQSYVSELRKTIGEVIERDGTGYAIRVDADGLDSLEFEARVTEARARLAQDPHAAIAELTATLSLWRGQAFEDFPDQPALQVEATRLDELRLATMEAALDARLTLGDHVAVAVELERLTRQYPYREELRALHMLALYRSGRQADALRAFQATRDALGEELGIEPSPRLRRLEEQILLQDPDLDLAPTATSPRSDTRLENPYMGLRAFREHDAARYYGREQLVTQLAERVAGAATFTAVVGPSGSGKSSAVQAGLVPRLRRDAPDLRITTMQPGSQPFAELETALTQLATSASGVTLTRLRASETALLESALQVLGADDRMLLVVDQFEELFTLADGEETQEFLAALVHAAGDSRRRVHVMVTMRADFYDRPLAAPQFGPLFAANVVNVVPMGPEELDAAATLPARQLDVTVEPRLVSRLIADVAGQPNALPLFQYALTELFDERSGPVLDLATYERIGGVRRAVARRAESLYTQLDAREQEAIRQLFLRIATISGSAVGRRRVPASELAALDVDIVALQTAIDAYARYRLLALDRDPTTGAPTVEVAHEALLGEWHRLRDWIEESREDLATHARFAIAVNEWEASGRDAGYLLTGSRLADYEMWAAASRLKLTETERAFIDEAVAARDALSEQDVRRETEAKRLRRRSRRQLVGLFVAVALLAGIVAYPLLTKDDPPEQIAIALSSARGAGSWEEILARSTEHAAEETGMEAVVLEPPYTNLVATYDDLAENARLVLGSFVLWEDMVAAAARHPDTTWVFLDYFEQPKIDNGVAVQYAAEQGAFLVGAAAALESETGRIGYIGANPSQLIEEFRAGFEQGARAARPDIEVISSLLTHDYSGRDGYLGSDEAHELASWMYAEENVDVIFTAAGGSGAGVIDAATTLSDELGRQLWAVGVDTDFVFELPANQREHVLTSMIKNIEVGIERVITDYKDGSLEVPSTLRLGLTDEAVGYTKSGNKLSPATIAAVDKLAAEIASGSRPVDRTAIGELVSPPPPPEAPDSPESRAALDVVSRYLTALQERDLDTAQALVAPFVSFEVFGNAQTIDFLTQINEFDAGQRFEFRILDCTARLPKQGLVVMCNGEGRDALAQAVGAPAASDKTLFTVTDGRITRFSLDSDFDFRPVDAYEQRFFTWLRETHPDEDVERAMCCGRNVETARQDGELRRRYAAEWAAYLEAEGCTYDEDC